MSSNVCSAIGYGFPLKDKKLNDAINDGEFDLPENIIQGFSGDSCADEMETFLFIKKSYKSVYLWDALKSPIKNDFFEVKPEWDEILKSFAKDNKIKKHKIGWWLIASD